MAAVLGGGPSSWAAPINPLLGHSCPDLFCAHTWEGRGTDCNVSLTHIHGPGALLEAPLPFPSLPACRGQGWVLCLFFTFQNPISLSNPLSCSSRHIPGQILWDLTGRICQSNPCKSQQELRGLILVCCIEKLPINISPLCFIITVKFVLCTYYLRDNRAGVPFYEAIIWFTLAP